MNINAKELLRSLGFIDMTGVRVMDGLVEKRRLHFPNSDSLKSKWSRSGDWTVITDMEGNVYMRCGSDDVTGGSVFTRVIAEFGCTKDERDMLIYVCIPPMDLHLNFEDVMERASSQLASLS